MVVGLDGFDGGNLAIREDQILFQNNLKLPLDGVKWNFVFTVKNLVKMKVQLECIQKIHDFFFCEKSRQNELSSALYSQNVNKLSRFFF